MYRIIFNKTRKAWYNQKNAFSI
ncbi:hypothetical protein JW758_02805 [Candidatus Peregrinibacteria bacterium]|nr:hypothetical protein [Candidatus Peregrinibacteria bacterium]